MGLGASQTRPQWLLVGAGLAVVIATYIFLVLSRPAGLNQSVTADSAGLIALAGNLIGSVLLI